MSFDVAELILPPGKSALTVQLVEGHFVESYYPTIENTFSKVIKYKGNEYATEIVDTAGQVCQSISFESMRPLDLLRTLSLTWSTRMDIAF